jgi:hypothetical protein
MKNKIDDLLNKRVGYPTPFIQSDPYLATKIAELAKEEHIPEIPSHKIYWSFASLITGIAVITGIFLGNNLMPETDQNTDFMSEYSSAFYQTDFTDNLILVNNQQGVQNEE